MLAQAEFGLGLVRDQVNRNLVMRPKSDVSDFARPIAAEVGQGPTSGENVASR
jgi:hypothetical protein